MHHNHTALRNKFVLTGLALTICAGTGCTPKRLPRVSLGDPAVFTSLHLRAAQVSLESDSSRPAASRVDMDRYLRTPYKDWDQSKLRMDHMLEQTQRGRSTSQAVISSLSVDLKVAANELVAVTEEIDEELQQQTSTDDTSEPADPGQQDETSPGEEELKAARDRLSDRVKLLTEQITALAEKESLPLPTDSPFDQIDRAQDFYTSVLHKSIRTYGFDSRLLDQQALYKILVQGELVQKHKAEYAEALAELAQAKAVHGVAITQAEQRRQVMIQGLYHKLTGSEMVLGKPQKPQSTSSTQLGTSVSDGSPQQSPATGSMAGATPPIASLPAPIGHVVLNNQPALSVPVLEALAETQRKIVFANAEGETQDDDDRARKDKEEQKEEQQDLINAVKVQKQAAEAQQKAAAEAIKLEIEKQKTLEQQLNQDEQDHDQSMEWFSELANLIDSMDHLEDDSGSKKAVEKATCLVADSKKTLDCKIKEYNDLVKCVRKGMIHDTVCDQGTIYQPDGDDWRLVLLLFQVHVHRGLEPNHMVGLRLKIEDTECLTSKSFASEKEPKIVRLHPTRNYDIEQQIMDETISEQLLASVQGQVDPSISGAIVRDLVSESVDRRRFLSRIPKIASWVDAPNSIMGWNFYPSNLNVRRRSPISRAFGLIYGPASRMFDVDAHLDPGARDCAAYLLVPADTKSITLDVSYIAGEMNSILSTERDFTLDDRGMPVEEGKNSSKLTIELPEYSPHEKAIVHGRILGGGIFPVGEVVPTVGDR